MSTDRTSPISVPNAENRQRRGSIADLFSRSNVNPTPQANQPNQASQTNQRRMSITTLGLSGSPTQTNTFGARNGSLRRGSVSSSIGSIPNEDAVEDTEGTSPNSQFARRVSFGAQALRDARGGSIGTGRHPPPSVVGPRRSPPPGSAIVATRSPASEGFNWSEALRSRAERAPSLSGPARQNGHQRAASIASMETPSRDMPRQPKQNKPDFFQEKILRGDFMD
ncbi:unnamed protein product [Penicillium bialowiezense]